jgi:hypothetical protein
MGWLTWKWFVVWVEVHPWQFSTGIILLFGSLGAAVMFSLNFPKLWEERKQRKREKQIRKYCEEMLKRKRQGISANEPLDSIPLFKKGEEKLRAEAYIRLINNKY